MNSDELRALRRGDSVVTTGKFESDLRGIGWVNPMDSLVGRTGEVVCFSYQGDPWLKFLGHEQHFLWAFEYLDLPKRKDETMAERTYEQIKTEAVNKGKELHKQPENPQEAWKNEIVNVLAELQTDVCEKALKKIHRLVSTMLKTDLPAVPKAPTTLVGGAVYRSLAALSDAYQEGSLVLWRHDGSRGVIASGTPGPNVGSEYFSKFIPVDEKEVERFFNAVETLQMQNTIVAWMNK